MKTPAKLILIMFLVFIAAYAYAAVPHLINYQGRLTDSGGVPLNGSYNITFRIYDAETAGQLLWEETNSGVVIQKGVFSVLLGSVTNLDLPFDKQYFLEIKVGTEVMSPRQRVASSGYAIRSEEAEKLGGKQPSDYALAADIAAVPMANKAVKLDGNAKLPTAALKVYDSGWFAASAGTIYTKTHNLGTTKVILSLYYSDTSDGSGDVVLCAGGWMADGALAAAMQFTIVDLTTTAVLMGGNAACLVRYYDKNFNIQTPASGYARIVMLALE